MKTATAQHTTFEALKETQGYTNVMQAPKIQKIVVSTGVGSIKDKKKIELIKGRLARITGQQPSPRSTTKSIANFKTRVGDLAGFQVTLRGSRAENFFQKLVHIVLPRVKDFRGIKTTSIDEMGNISIGIKEHTVFPETTDEDAKDVFGLSVTITTTAKSEKEAEALLRHIGLPFRE